MVERNKKQFNTLLQNASSSQKLSEVLVYLYEGHNFSLYEEGESITVLFLAVQNKVEFKISYTVSGRDWKSSLVNIKFEFSACTQFKTVGWREKCPR